MKFHIRLLMPVDYSKFKDIEDSDEEPIIQAHGGKNIKGLSQKVVSALESSANNLKSRRCFCFLDLSCDLMKLRDYADEIYGEGGVIPPRKQLGRVILELDQASHAPHLCENFRSLFTGERGYGVGKQKLHYKGHKVALILPKFCVQISIPNEYSCWGRYLDDEELNIPGLSFDRPGLVAASNHGPNTNSCSLMITLNEAEHLNGYNQIIGHVVSGMEVLRVIEHFPTDRKTKSFLEKDVKSWWGGAPTVDVLVEDSGEIPECQMDVNSPHNGDGFPEHPEDWSCQNSYEVLFPAAEQIRKIGNAHFKKKEYKIALEKYRKAQAYLKPLLKKQDHEVYGDEEPSTWLSGGVRLRGWTELVHAQYTVQLNAC